MLQNSILTYSQTQKSKEGRDTNWCKIVASKNFGNKPLSDETSKVFEMTFDHVESFHRKSLFYTCFEKFWVVENSFSFVKN